MINQKDIYVGLNLPSNNEPLWIKPLTDGNVALYARVYGEWIAANSHALYYTKTEIDEFLAGKANGRYIDEHKGMLRSNDTTEFYDLDNTWMTYLGSWGLTLRRGDNNGVITYDGKLKVNDEAVVMVSDLADKENAMPITTATGLTLSAVVGNYYRLDNVGTLAITLPTITGATKLQGVTFMLTTGTTPLITITSAGEETILYQMDITTLEPNTSYEMTALWNGSEWALTTITYQ